MTYLTPKQLAIIGPNIPKAKLQAFCDALNEAMQSADITNENAQAMFIAQTFHESVELLYAREIASGAAYDTGQLAKNLGNTPGADGDGQKYKGGGWLQVTGLDNYKALTRDVGVKYGVDFVKNPERITEPKFAALSATWYWNSRKLTPIATLGTEDAFLKVTKIINGGTNGLADRKTYWEKAKKVLDPAWILANG